MKEQHEVKRPRDLPAGDFSSWLRHARNALRTDGGTDVACGECIGCCTSSYFIHIGPEEGDVLANVVRLPSGLLMNAAYPETAARVQALGHEARLVDISEFGKAEAGLTCMSLLFGGAA